MSTPKKLSARREQAQAFSRLALAAEAFVVGFATLVQLAVEGSARDREREAKYEAERLATREREQRRFGPLPAEDRVG